jgi:hypothetical protein
MRDLFEQKFNSLINESRRFKQLAVGKLGDAKPLLFEQEQSGGDFLNVAILDGNVNYYPGVKDIRRAQGQGTTVAVALQPNQKRGPFNSGWALLKFNKSYGTGAQAINLNSNKNYVNEMPIEAGDYIIGQFDSWGLVNGTLYKSNKEGNDPFAETNVKSYPLIFNPTADPESEY